MTLFKTISGPCVAGILGVVSLSAAIPASLDLNGDGKSDVLWENMSSGRTYVWTLNGLHVDSEIVLPAFSDANWRIAGLGDTNGDGTTDIVWRNTLTGDNHLWIMNGLSATEQAPLPSMVLAWRITGVADVNGDGLADVLWRNNDTGENHVWFMAGSTVTSGGALPLVPLQRTLAGIGDVNGDGRADVIWRTQATGDNYLWTLDGLNVMSETALAALPPAWLLSGMADYNGDGKADAIWSNAETGENYAWFMDGIAIEAQGSLPTVADVNWKMSAFGDYNGDGNADILWRHATNGQNYLWLMNAATLVSDGFLPPVTERAWASRIELPPPTQSAQAASSSGGGGGPTPGTGAPNTTAATMPAASSFIIDLSGDFKLAGGHPLTLTTTAPTTLTLPTSGTLATNESLQPVVGRFLPLEGGQMTGRLDINYGDSARWTASDGNVFGLMTGDVPFDGVTDNIFNWGYNIDIANLRTRRTREPYDPAEPYLYFSIESNYNAGTDRLMEYHLNYRGIGENRTLRPLNFNISRITHKSHWGFTAEDFFFGNSDQSQLPVFFNFAGTAGSSTVKVAPVNAAATGLTVYGARGQTANVLETRNTIDLAGNVPTFYVKHDASGNGQLAVNDRLGNEQVVIPGDGAGTASFKVGSILMALPSNRGQVRLSGNNGVGAFGLETSTGVPVFTFLNLGDNAIHGDNRDIVISPNNAERIRFGAAGGSGSKVAVTGALTASSTIKPASFTVDTLPSASEAGPGATAYASNGRRSGEGPGAGTGIPVWSDGATWRTYYDNTVVAR